MPSVNFLEGGQSWPQPAFSRLLVFGLLILLLTGCGSFTNHGPIDPALAAFIPPDTIALAGIRMDQLRAMPIYRKLERESRLPQLGQFPSRDIHDMLIASDGAHVVAIARGAFPAKPAGGLSATQYKGFTLYGDSEAVRSAIHQSTSGGKAPHDLMARAEALPANTQLWVVVAGWRGFGADQLRRMGNFANLDRVLRLVESASLTVDLRTGVHAAFTGDSRTEADAKNLADSLRGLAAVARMAVPHNQPDLLRAFDGLQVKQEGRVVQVNIDIAEDVAEKLAR
ncbi:MAG: hypothetical protein ABSF54_02870 [Bryobacteraceae bacterium]